MNPNYLIRNGEYRDIADIAHLFKEQLFREPNDSLIVDALRAYPSVVSYYEDKLVGFAYCGYMAPDLLELMNITVHSDHRAAGVGSFMLSHLHSEVSKEYAAIMVTNSILYPANSNKRAATNFYLRNGYQLVASTGSTNMFWKLLSE